METIVRPLGGDEIKNILKIRLTEIVDKIPLLRKGNTFKRAQISFAFAMTAFPEDVPVPPEIEMEFNIDMQGLEGDEEFKARRKLVKKLNAKLEEINNLLEILASRTIEEVNIDATIPDKVRIDHGMPIRVLQHLGEEGEGKRVEVEIDPKSEKFNQLVGGTK